MTGRWFSPGTPVSSTNKTDRHDITEIVLKVALNTINQPNNKYISGLFLCLMIWVRQVVRFVDISGIVDHHCLHLLFIIDGMNEGECFFLYYKSINCINTMSYMY